MHIPFFFPYFAICNFKPWLFGKAKLTLFAVDMKPQLPEGYLPHLLLIISQIGESHLPLVQVAALENL